MVVVVYAYTGLMTSMLATPKLEPIVTSLDDLVERGNLRVTAEKVAMLTNEYLVN